MDPCINQALDTAVVHNAGMGTNFSPRDTWQGLETFLIIVIGGGVYLLGRDQGCGYTPSNTQDSPHHKEVLSQSVSS